MAQTGTIYINESAKQTPKDRVKKEIKKLDKLVEGTEEIIYEISSVFPFQFFPDKIIIDKNKVTIVRKDIFFKRTFPMLIRDIKTVKVSRGFLFASIEFEIRGYEINPRPTNYLWPEQAIKAQQYILGLMSAKREGVDLSEIPTEKARGKLRKIGKSKEETGSLF